METLHTIDQVIKAFGGPVKCARWAKSSNNAVCWWRHRGIPPGIHLRLVIELHRRGYVVAREVLGLEQDDYAFLYQSLIPKPPTPRKRLNGKDRVAA